jgi:hypothetical protein
MQALSATFATISDWMRLNRFSNAGAPDPGQPSTPQQPMAQVSQSPQPRTGRTFPADEVVWGIVIRNGFDEIDDPWYHRGTTQHAYLEGNDNVAICGFRPPQSGPRTRRRTRLGLPTTGEHPMCGMCARMVVAPRPRVPVPVHPLRPAVGLPVAGPVGQPMPPAVMASPAGAYPGVPAPAQAAATSPWVRRASGAAPAEPTPSVASHDAGLLARGVHAEAES